MICNACKSDLSVPKTVKVFLGGESDTPATPRMINVVSFLEGNGSLNTEVSAVADMLAAGLRVVRLHCGHCNEYLKGVS